MAKRGYSVAVVVNPVFRKLESVPQLAQSAPASKKCTVKGPTLEIKDGAPQFTKDAGSEVKYFPLRPSTWRGRNKTMSDLATDLAKNLCPPVTGATGLEGEYDYALTFILVPTPKKI